MTRDHPSRSLFRPSFASFRPRPTGTTERMQISCQRLERNWLHLSTAQLTVFGTMLSLRESGVSPILPEPENRFLPVETQSYRTLSMYLVPPFSYYHRTPVRTTHYRVIGFGVTGYCKRKTSPLSSKHYRSLQSIVTF